MLQIPFKKSALLNHQLVVSTLYIALLAFMMYTTVYAFRKPFTVVEYGSVVVWGLPYQTLLVIAQVIGYMLSKFAGIRFISELKSLGRWKSALLLVMLSWISLSGLALLPSPWGLPCMFLNGFCLGFLWGIVFSYVEGRRTTDFIGACMAVSFIFAGGFTRSVAVYVKNNISFGENWVPFLTGLIFVPPFLLFLYLLEKLPPPGKEDIAEREPRLPMDGSMRKTILKEYGWGLFFITAAYLFLTIMRDIRDNFMINMWNELGFSNHPDKYASTETITTLLVLGVMASMVFIKNSLMVFRRIHLLVFIGFGLAGFSSVLFLKGLLPGALWMQLAGLGLYLAYIPFNCIFFERMIAAFKMKGNVGFLIYIADAFGYLGSMLVMISKSFIQLEIKWINFYSVLVIVLSLIGLIFTFLSAFYFRKKTLQLH